MAWFYDVVNSVKQRLTSEKIGGQVIQPQQSAPAPSSIASQHATNTEGQGQSSDGTKLQEEAEKLSKKSGLLSGTKPHGNYGSGYGSASQRP